MRRVLRFISSLLAVLLFMGFGLAAHVSAMPMASNEMVGMSHSMSSSSVNCAALCANSVIFKQEKVLAIREDKDDEPITPFYVACQQHRFSDNETEDANKAFATSVKPPPKVPIHILHGVFRV